MGGVAVWAIAAGLAKAEVKIVAMTMGFILISMLSNSSEPAASLQSNARHARKQYIDAVSHAYA
jgi:hypothetical protein